eukprot:1205794-Pyramimonas_sp.AAC.1
MLPGNGEYLPNGGPRYAQCGFGRILTTDQSDAGSAGIFSRRTNRTQEAPAGDDVQREPTP